MIRRRNCSATSRMWSKKILAMFWDRQMETMFRFSVCVDAVICTNICFCASFLCFVQQIYREKMLFRPVDYACSVYFRKNMMQRLSKEGRTADEVIRTRAHCMHGVMVLIAPRVFVSECVFGQDEGLYSVLSQRRHFNIPTFMSCQACTCRGRARAGWGCLSLAS